MEIGSQVNQADNKVIDGSEYWSQAKIIISEDGGLSKAWFNLNLVYVYIGWNCKRIYDNHKSWVSNKSSGEFRLVRESKQ